MPALIALDPGPLATVQDLGRLGWQRYGVVVAGAMDAFAFRAANALVGNPADRAAIELTLAGGRWEVDGGDVRVAVTGGAFRIAVDGRPVPPWRSFVLRGGEILSIGSAPDAVRGYLAVAGGIDVPPVLGSRSTHVRSGIGGWQGRALAGGDRLPIGLAAGDCGDLTLPEAAFPAAADRIRVILGPQDDHFDAAAIAAFLDGIYVVTKDADRMGYRLDGPRVPHAGNDNIVSDGIAMGSVQIPGNGLPIVLLADRQPTGGYPKIATVIGPDLRTIAQARPGDRLRFQRVDPATAQRIRMEWDRRLADIGGALRSASDDVSFASARLLALNLVSGVVAGDEP